MKQVFLLFFCSLVSQICSQVQYDWEWAIGTGDQHSEYGQAIAHDGKGNIYLAIRGSGSQYSLNCGTQGSTIAKLDSAGALIWARGLYADVASCSVDRQGNLYLCGSLTTNNLFCNGISANFITATCTGMSDAYLAKYSPLGQLQWVVSWGYDNSTDETTAIKTDSNGNSFVTGYSKVPTGSMSEEFFLRKIDNQGKLIWEDKSGFKGRAIANGIDLDRVGNCYLTGTFTDTSYFGSILMTSPAPKLLTIFIAKYSSQGKILWVQSEGTNLDRATSISCDKNGFFYIAGTYLSPSKIGGSVLTTGYKGFHGVFIAKYDTAGNFVWVRNADATSVKAVISSNKGGCIITGDFHGNATFSGIINTRSVTTSMSKNREIFVSRYDSFGELIWVLTPTSTVGAATNYFGVQNSSSSICSDKNENYYLTGHYSEVSQFGNTLLIATSQYQNILVAKLSRRIDIQDTTNVGITTDHINKIEVYPNPTGDYLNILNRDITSKFNVRLIDVKGDIVHNIFHDGNSSQLITLPVTHIAKGIYILIFQTDFFVESKKIIVQ
jgi:hypothetical protein